MSNEDRLLEAEIVTEESLPVQHKNPTSKMDRNDAELDIGQWYWIEDTDDDKQPVQRLCCITKLLSNAVELKSPNKGDYETTWRVLLTEFEGTCKPEPDAEQIINEKILGYQQEVYQLMGEVKQLTAALGIIPRQALDSGSNETQAIALRGTGESVADYKESLIKAKEKSLPELFEKIKAKNEQMATWMQAPLLGLKAQVKQLKPLIEKIEGRIFNVELYAGLIEEVELIKDGEPAAIDAPVRLFQRRAYMDEECLVNYQTGGMRFRNLHRFDAWLVKPENLNRLLPFDRCILAFQVRRKAVEGDPDKLTSLGAWIHFANEAQLDKLTFLYMRNGEQVYRLSTGIDFGSQLFPDTDHSILNGQIYVDIGGTRDSVRDIISEGEYKERMQAARNKKREYTAKMREWVAAGKPSSDRPYQSHDFHPITDYQQWTPKHRYYDEIAAHIKKMMDEHNRLVLVLQGLLDRSPVFHPHAPWQLWTAEGFTQAIQLIYDDSRGLVAGDKPDFKDYMLRLSAQIEEGSVTINQGDIWAAREAEKENARRDNSRRGDERHVRQFRPYGNPGPGEIARVQKVTKTGNCTFNWMRERQRPQYRQSAELPCSITIPAVELFNVSGYKPGDYKTFFADPRTRADYLKWAPLMLEAEEYYAGNRKVNERRPKPVTCWTTKRGAKKKPLNHIPGSPQRTFKLLAFLYDAPGKMQEHVILNRFIDQFHHWDAGRHASKEMYEEAREYCLAKDWIKAIADGKQTFYKLTADGFVLISNLIDKLGDDVDVNKEFEDDDEQIPYGSSSLEETEESITEEEE